jgi:hypothetical protein
MQIYLRYFILPDKYAFAGIFFTQSSSFYPLNRIGKRYYCLMAGPATYRLEVINYHAGRNSCHNMLYALVMAERSTGAGPIGGMRIYNPFIA